MLPLCREEGIGVVPWSPLARGFLAGNRNRESDGETLRAKTDDYARKLYYAEEDFAVVDRVLELARGRDVKPTQIALSWLMHKPGVTSPIIGTGTIEHLEDASAALNIELSEEEQKYLEEPYKPHAVLGHR